VTEPNGVIHDNTPAEVDRLLERLAALG